MMGDDMSDSEWEEFVSSGGAAAVMEALFSVQGIHDYTGFSQAQRQEFTRGFASVAVTDIRAAMAGQSLINAVGSGMAVGIRPPSALAPVSHGGVNTHSPWLRQVDPGTLQQTQQQVQSVSFLQALFNSIEIEGSYGVGIGGSGRIGVAEVQGVLAGAQTHSWNLGTGEYNQRNHVFGELGANVSGQAGIMAGFNTGYTYSSIHGYVLENGRIVPTTYGMFGVFAGDAVFGLGGEGFTDSDFTLGIGLSAYFIIGGGFDVSINFSELTRQLNTNAQSQTLNTTSSAAWSTSAITNATSGTTRTTPVSGGGGAAGTAGMNIYSIN